MPTAVGEQHQRCQTRCLFSCWRSPICRRRKLRELLAAVSVSWINCRPPSTLMMLTLHSSSIFSFQILKSSCEYWPKVEFVCVLTSVQEKRERGISLDQSGHRSDPWGKTPTGAAQAIAYPTLIDYEIHRLQRKFIELPFKWFQSGAASATMY